ncbi:MAG: CBS domain-containing protein [Candidatus Bathyarchaeia archaeon]|nr:CBS domain-containing protein [Candidatus Bathyarchaeota archaeon]
MLPELDAIAAKRRMLGLTQSKLAELTGVSQSYIAKLESRKIEPSYRRIKAILEVLESLEQRSEMKASEVMTQDVVSVQVNDPVQKAVDLMRSHGFSQLPVLEGDKPVGSISERTLIERMIYGEDRGAISKRPVSEVMDEAFPQVGEDAPISLLTSLLRVYPAVLVSRRGKMIGIITKADLLKTLG